MLWKKKNLQHVYEEAKKKTKQKKNKTKLNKTKNR